MGSDGSGASGADNHASVNGLSVYHEVHGSGDQLVLLRGGFGATGMFGVVLPTLAEGRRVVAVDLQAHGRTADVDRALSLGAMADDVAALLRRLGQPRAARTPPWAPRASRSGA